jgi:hypothetical protein
MMLLQQYIEDAIKQAAPVFTTGVLLEGVTLSTSAKSVNHTLGRKALGYWIVKRSANAVVYDTAIDDQTLTLVASGSVTVSLWVF